MRDAVLAIKDNAASGIQGQHGLDGHMRGGGVERLKHDLRPLLPDSRDTILISGLLYKE